MEYFPSFLPCCLVCRQNSYNFQILIIEYYNCNRAQMSHYTAEDIKAIIKDRYLTKEELKYRVGLENLEEVWNILKFSRTSSSMVLPYEPLKLTYVITPQIAEELHLCDTDAENILKRIRNSAVSAPAYLSDALSVEAISSSRLEGAVTTEAVAREILRKQKPPKNKDEQMIVNNHHAMQFIRSKGDVPLTPEFICEIQRMVTADTLKNPDDSGAFRTTDDVVVVNSKDGEVVHHPPAASEVPRLVAALCEFVNRENSCPFVHPVITAIALHFLIGYIHPFYDGNGRTARTLFYWYLLSRGYEVFSYLPISKSITESPRKYRDAYVATEEDDLDLTYFILHSVSCIQKARKVLSAYLAAEEEKKKELLCSIDSLPHLSRRQKSIFAYMVSYADETFGIAEVAERFGVTYQTARTDLMQMEARGYLRVEKVGKSYSYTVADGQMNL